MEKVTAGASGFRVVVHLPVDVIKDFGLIREGAFDRKLGCGIGLGAGCLVDRLVVFFGDDPLADEGVFPKLDGIVFVDVSLDFLLCPVFVSIRIGNGVSLVPVG